MPTKKTDINTATQQDLEQVPQMSSARAETIIHYREQHGRFKNINELTNVPGIGEIMAQQMAEFFSVGGADDEKGSRSNDDDNDTGGDPDNDEDEGVDEDEAADNNQSASDDKGGNDNKAPARKRRAASSRR